MKYFFSVILLLTCFAQSVFAQVDTDDFTIRVFGGSDTTPPSTPTLLSVAPIASTQIDITWSAATDDYIVSGYSILRDAVPIATTSLLSYSDTGLTASTTYVYTVRAFDSSFNYSSTSNSIATTTPDTPPPPPPPPPGETTQATAARVVLDDLQIEVGVSTTSFTLQTAHQARLELRWGRTASYELGYVVSNVFTKEHAVLLTDLEPGTTYEYEIVGYTPFGIQTVLKNGSFTTLSRQQLLPPPNVSRFKAVGVGDDVELSWDIPAGEDIAYVRIVRSHLGFPEHPQDGAIVYQGLKGSVRDEGVLAMYSPVFYTAFVYDKEGNISSGAVSIVYATRDRGEDSVPGSGEAAELPPIGIGETLVPIDEATSTVVTKRLTVDMKMPKLSDITITQAGRMLTFIDPGITLDPAQSFTISLPRSAVAGNLKSIIATIIDPTDNRQTYSFLLRINNDRTAYEAEIAALGVSGESQVVVEIYDYEAFVVGTYQAPLVFAEAEKPAAVVFPDTFFRYWPHLIVLFLVLFGLMLLFFLVKHRKGEDNGR